MFAQLGKKTMKTVPTAQKVTVPTVSTTTVDGPEGDIGDSKATTSPITAPTPSMLRATGRRTPSMGRKAGKADKVFPADGPTAMIPPKTVFDNQVYRIVQEWTYPAWLVSSSVAEANVAAFFSLIDSAQSASLQAVFDQYRISMVEVWLIPRLTVAFTANINAGLLYSVVDYDDAAPVNVLGLQQYSNCLVGRGTCVHYRKFKPHAAVAAYAGAFTSYANETAPWLDCGSPNIQHYGFKAGVTTTDTTYNWDLVARLQFDFRNVR
jgi:hypothetical protein